MTVTFSQRPENITRITVSYTKIRMIKSHPELVENRLIFQQSSSLKKKLLKYQVDCEIFIHFDIFCACLNTTECFPTEFQELKSSKNHRNFKCKYK